MDTILPWHQQDFAYLVDRKNLNKFPHAILLNGASGIGKLLLAKNIAALLFCEQTEQAAVPCGTCDACMLLRANNHPDLLVVQPEEPGKAIKIDQVREVIADLSNTSHRGGYKILIIEPAELLNVAAANALLKTLEEPAPYTVIILVAAHPRMLPATIRSRCQMLSIDTPKYLDAEAWLRKQMPEADATLLLALAENAPLKALSLAQGDFLRRRQEFLVGLDECWQGKNGVAQMVTHCLDWEIEEFLLIMLYAVTDVIKIKFNDKCHLVNQDQIARFTTFAIKANLGKLFAYQDHLYKLRRCYLKKISLNHQMVMENLIIEWLQLLAN